MNSYIISVDDIEKAIQSTAKPKTNENKIINVLETTDTGTNITVQDKPDTKTDRHAHIEPENQSKYTHTMI